MSGEPIIFVAVDYDEFKPETYRGVVLTVGVDGQEIRFADHSDFAADSQAAKNWIARYFPTYLAVCVSSYDNFEADREAATSVRQSFNHE
jgi:hypothetical protein